MIASALAVVAWCSSSFGAFVFVFGVFLLLLPFVRDMFVFFRQNESNRRDVSKVFVSSSQHSQGPKAVRSNKR